MGPWVIQALTHNDIDDVLAIEEAAFTNPWTRAMYLAELQNSGVSYCFLARNPGGRGEIGRASCRERVYSSV